MTDTDIFANPVWMNPATGEPRPVEQLMWAIVAELPAIGKDRQYKEGNTEYKFRGIDDALNALNPVLSKWGVFYTPRVLEQVVDKKARGANGALWDVVRLHVEYTFHGPNGDTVTADAWGEGLDNADKTTNKAMTNALKNVLYQSFCISTKEMAVLDNENSSPPDAPDYKYQCRPCWETDPDDTFKTDDIQAFADHVAAHHPGFEVTAEGRLRKGRSGPPAAPTPTEPPVEPPATAEPILAPAADPVAGDPDPTPSPSEPSPPGPSDEAPPDTGPGHDWVNNAPKPELVARCAALGLATNGNMGVLRQRLIDHYAPEAPPDVFDLVGTGEPGDPRTETPPASDDDAVICPECEAELPNEDAYNEHWFKEHGESDSAEDVPTDSAPASPEGDAPADAATIKLVKEAVAALKGQRARAYATYRRDKSLPNPDGLTWSQASDLLDYLDRLPA